MRDMIQRVLDQEAEALTGAARDLDYSQVEAVIRALKECRGKIILSACGTSAQAARKIAHTLCCAGCPALFIPPSDGLHGGMGVIEARDVVILITKGGQTKELVQMIGPVRAIGAKVIMVTENEDRGIALGCDLMLKIKVKREPDPFNMLATASTLAVIAVFDAISIDLMEELHYTKERFARIHPEGEVGQRLAGEAP